MMNVHVKITALNENGFNVLKKINAEPLSMKERYMIWKSKTQYEKSFSEKDETYEIKYTMQGTINPEVLKEKVIDMNKMLLASKGAWETDYTTEVKVW